MRQGFASPAPVPFVPGTTIRTVARPLTPSPLSSTVPNNPDTVKCSFTRSDFYVTELSMNQRIGYARVSTDDQNLDLQRDALRHAGCSTIYEDATSGKASVRPEFELCKKALSAGDTLVVWRLDRLGRNMPDLVQIVADCERRGVNFESLTEKIETGSPAGKLQFHVFAALAEFERSLIRERTQAGLAAARARGRSGGRKPKLSSKQIRHIKALLRDPNTSVAKLARDYGVSRTTIYKYCGVIQPQHD